VAQEERDVAKTVLGEATAIAESGGLQLHLIDCELASVRVHLRFGDREAARNDLTRAHDRVATLGYWRRLGDVQSLASTLGQVF
jgi:hypothetical protein